MQATIKLADGQRLIQVEGETQADLFEQMAQAYEVFNETHCGLCGSSNIRPIMRMADKYRFYEYACCEPNCWGKLTFGQSQENKGALFPKRKLLPNGKPDSSGEYGEHNGWTRYRGENRQEDSPPERAPGIPPASPLVDLRNLLGDMGVTDNEWQFRDKVIQFATRGPLVADYSKCSKSPESAKHALKRLQDAIAHYGSADEMLVEVQRWMAAAK